MFDRDNRGQCFLHTVLAIRTIPIGIMPIVKSFVFNHINSLSKGLFLFWLIYSVASCKRKSAMGMSKRIKHPYIKNALFSAQLQMLLASISNLAVKSRISLYLWVGRPLKAQLKSWFTVK